MEPKIFKAEFIKSITNLKDKPKPEYPEFAFVGRSNVGKSSLINTLTKRKKLAHTSNTPGKTRLINYFNINDLFYLVDLPGYGYARVSKTEREAWKHQINAYLRNNEYLKLVFVLTDIRHGPQPGDIAVLDMLMSLQIPAMIVATKSDKLSNNQIRNHLHKYYEKIGIDRENVIVFSSVNEQGRKDILNILFHYNS
ncbi:MAG: ribosome biogenesis GTP-binding protein YihA/YsxC [Calditrichia bacterium]